MPSFINREKANLISTILLILVVVLGVWNIIYVGRNVDRNGRQELLLRAQNISVLVNQDDIKSLTGTMADLENPAYNRIKKTLEDIHSINTDTRFVYLMGLTSDEKQFFYADSEDPASEGYSPPGQLYLESLPIDLYNHIHGISYTNGPYSDEWGTWISAYAPVLDTETKKVIALVGIDVDADHFLSQIFTARLIVFAISLIVFLAILFLERLLKRSNAYGTELEKINRDLSSSKDYLLEIEHQAGIGELSWSVATNIITLDQIIMDVLSTSLPKMPLEQFLEYINPQDLIRIKDEIESKKDITGPLTLRYHLRDAHHKDHAITSICSIKRDSKGEIVTMRCTAQDMTDIRE
jgi:hypothetical protein